MNDDILEEALELDEKDLHYLVTQGFIKLVGHDPLGRPMYSNTDLGNAVVEEIEKQKLEDSMTASGPDKHNEEEEEYLEDEDWDEDDEDTDDDLDDEEADEDLDEDEDCEEDEDLDDGYDDDEEEFIEDDYSWDYNEDDEEDN